MDMKPEDVDTLKRLVEVVAGPELTRLRAELAEERELNRNLWVAVGKLRVAHGIAYGVMDGGQDHETMCRLADQAGTVLDGIIGLTPAEDDA